MTKQYEGNLSYYGMSSSAGLLTRLAARVPYSLAYGLGYVWAQSVEPLRVGFFRSMRYRRFLTESQWWTRERLESYQLKRLREILEYAYKYVPYYTELFRKASVQPQDIASLRDLKRIPLTSKEDIVEHFDAFLSTRLSPKERKQRLILRSTSGSTGSQLFFYRDQRFAFSRWEYDNWRLSLLKIKQVARNIQIWSRPFVNCPEGAVVFHNPYLNMLSLSSLPKRNDSFKKYFEIIKKFRPAYVCGAPSFMYLLAQYAQDHKIKDVAFDVFISAYENLYPFQKQCIEKQFSCGVYRFYASEENVMFGAECLQQEGMHIELRKGVLEVVDTNGKMVPDGEHGRIICTGFDNQVMPLIRYDIGDTGIISPQPCSCGRGLPLLQQLDGRTSELLVLKGHPIYPATLSVVLCKVENIRECQFEKLSDDTLRIRVVKRPAYTVHDEERLCQLVRDLVHEELAVTVEYFESLPRTALGKFPIVVDSSGKK